MSPSLSPLAQSPAHPARTAAEVGGEDVSLASAATAAFAASAYGSLRGVECDCRAGVLTLRGQVPTYFLKQVALKLAKDVAGVQAVVNRLEVLAEAARGS